MPVIRDRLNVQHRNGIRADQRIESLAQPVRSQLTLDIDMSTHRQCMDPGIGAAGGDELRLLAGHALHRLLEALLDRRPMLLPLPAHERAAVIFDREFPAGHWRQRVTEEWCLLGGEILERTRLRASLIDLLAAVPG